jgi:hypothetical protein
VSGAAWPGLLGTNMAEAIDFMALYLPQEMDMSFVCSRCKDKSKCGACGFFKTTNPTLITMVKQGGILSFRFSVKTGMFIANATFCIGTSKVIKAKLNLFATSK